MDKVALVTGSAKRIGAAIVRRIHQSGFNVVIHYHESNHEAELLCNELNSLRANSACSVSYDLNDEDSYSAIIDECLKRFNRLDVLVNNASTFYPIDIGKIDGKTWDDLMNVNLKAPMFLIQKAAEALRQFNGCVVNITDIHGYRPLKHYSVYSTAKAGLIMLTKAMAKELAPDIRVNAVSPGAIDWPEEMESNIKDNILNKIAMRRKGSTDDITDAVMYLINDADYMTGQILTIDGGRSLLS